jgi:hypothetical protein
MREGGNRLAFDRDWMLVNLSVKGLAENDSVFMGRSGCRGQLCIAVEPKLNAIKEVEPGPVRQTISAFLVLGAKEDRCGKNTLETLHNALIVAAVFGETEEIQHLSGAMEPDDSALLLDSECRYPDRNEPILTEGQIELGMRGDLKEELAIAPSVVELIFG